MHAGRRATLRRALQRWSWGRASRSSSEATTSGAWDDEPREEELGALKRTVAQEYRTRKAAKRRERHERERQASRELRWVIETDKSLFRGGDIECRFS